MIVSKTNKILTFPSPFRLDIVDIDQGEEWGGASSVGGGIRRRRMMANQPPHREWRKRARRAAAGRGRRGNGRIMGGRGLGIDGRRKRLWRREGGGCGAADSSWLLF